MKQQEPATDRNTAPSFRLLTHRLTPLYGSTEAKAVVRTVLETAFGLSLTDIFTGKINELSANDTDKLEKIMQQLLTGRPVQYVLGQTEFCGHTFNVREGVLIPRPETEELCRLISNNLRQHCRKPIRILDIGTGSGCIAITLALTIPNTLVDACDISETALHIARENAQHLHAPVKFFQYDILTTPTATTEQQKKCQYDLIVSNPPYVCEQEKAQMEPNVLHYEPPTALFVPDNDPLRFYKAIAAFAQNTLSPSGQLFLEINPIYAHQLRKLLQENHFEGIQILNDQFGKARMLKAETSETAT